MAFMAEGSTGPESWLSLIKLFKMKRIYVEYNFYKLIITYFLFIINRVILILKGKQRERILFAHPMSEDSTLISLAYELVTHFPNIRQFMRLLYL